METYNSVTLKLWIRNLLATCMCISLYQISRSRALSPTGTSYANIHIRYILTIHLLTHPEWKILHRGTDFVFIILHSLICFQINVRWNWLVKNNINCPNDEIIRDNHKMDILDWAVYRKGAVYLEGATYTVRDLWNSHYKWSIEWSRTKWIDQGYLKP